MSFKYSQNPFFVGPSIVCALPLATGINKWGNYFWYCKYQTQQASSSRAEISFSPNFSSQPGLQKVGTAGAGQTTFGWTKLDLDGKQAQNLCIAAHIENV